MLIGSFILNIKSFQLNWGLAICWRHFLFPRLGAFLHDDVIKWKHFPRYWPFVRGIHRSPVNSPHKGQWRGAIMFSLICVWINGWVNNREAGDLRRYRAHYDVTVMVNDPTPEVHYLKGVIYTVDSRYITAEYNTTLHTLRHRES